MYVEFLQDVHLPNVGFFLSDGSANEPTYLGLNNGSGISINNLSWQNIPSIRLRRSLIAGHVPSSLAAGELAQNLPDEMLFYRNPSGVVTPFKLPDGVRLIAAGTVANAANLAFSIDPAVIGIMRGFMLQLTNWRPASSGSLLQLQMGDSGGIDVGSSDYEWGHVYACEANGSFGDVGSDNTSSDVDLEYTGDSNTASGSQALLWLGTNDPAATVRNIVIAQGCSWYNFSGFFQMVTMSYGARKAVLAMTQFLLKYSSGNISTGRYGLLGFPDGQHDSALSQYHSGAPTAVARGGRIGSIIPTGGCSIRMLAAMSLPACSGITR
jgi:hypothetical protein